MREIVWDTETTGFDPQSGDRLVEIGAVELLNHMPTGKVYHQYINPERSMPAEAFAVHGLGDEFLADKPLFKSIAQDFLDFIGDAKIVAHNAKFDMRFINAELQWVGIDPIPMTQSVDTLEIARKKFPGAQNSLDALCRRFGIDNSAREKHGALLDSEILAEVYLELVGGRQPDFALSVVAGRDVSGQKSAGGSAAVVPRSNPLPSKLTAEEAKAHQEFIDKLGSDALWNKLS
ncbi:DNA polymerase III subunit epsilon [Amylibacter sp. SFDW26]|uniref:DNA polymerase III subunit epsilon n=1 Tax=Amylibacter sp. SFDW26 TaxID=2652722 RepID=UPI0012620DD5|nr:DNA polymerase III subunit epsilon [Amylibacter sp. SFDW26]KAB7614571.1 DNA polymerase III subunit epsilon [Amylibacter sp. SFDW26]